MNKERHIDIPKEAIASEQEIERKFTVRTLPENLQEFPRSSIEQGYLSIDAHSEARIRRQDDTYTLTYKRGSGLVRDEKEIPLSEEQFQALWPKTEGRRVSKDRHTIVDEQGLIELDVYKGALEGIQVAEVEFKTVEASKSFTPPAWFGTEVTEDKRYKNQQLALEQIAPHLKKEKPLFKEQALKDGVKEVIDLIEAQKTEKTPVIVMVAGRTSSGKTSAVSSEITEAFDAKVLSMDDYSLGNSHVDEMARKGTPINWDHPGYMDFDLLNEHIAALKRGEAIDKPTFSFKTGERDVSERFEPSDVIIVEGLFALRDEIQHHGDVKTFVDISLHGSIIRRLLRDVKRTNMEPIAILRYYLSTVEPMYQEHIVASKQNADVVLVSEYNPKHEADRSEVYEVQTKFRTPEDIKSRLQKAGAEHLGKVQERDTYLEPTDKDFTRTDEIMRIRKKGNTILLGYKGPRTTDEMRVRPKFEFEIDEAIEKNLLGKYGEQVKEITKTREIFHLDGVIVTVDSDVIKQQGNEAHPLGDFVEIRSNDKEKGEEQIKDVAKHLGLELISTIRTSYSEM